MQEQLQSLWDVLQIGEETTDESVVTRVYEMFPANPVFSHYMGSLTTPPCTEVSHVVEGLPVDHLFERKLYYYYFF